MSTLKQMALESQDTEDLVDRVLSDKKVKVTVPRVWVEVLDDRKTLTRMLDQLVRDRRHSDRKKAEAADDFPVGDTDEKKQQRMEGLNRREEAFRNTLWFYPIYSNKPLKDCRKSDLAQSIQQREDNIAGNMKRLDFERLVHNALPNARTTVGQAITIDRLKQFHKEAFTQMRDAA